MTMPHLYRYGHTVGVRLQWLRDLILGSHVYAPSTAELNDPLEGAPRLVDLTAQQAAQFLIRMNHRRLPSASLEELARHSVAIKGGIEAQGLASVRREMAVSLREELRAVRVVSLSRRVDNFNMWAQYARGHRGYCLEFARAGIFRQARPVSYDDAVPLDPNDDEQDKSIFLFHKKSEWMGEEEERIVLPRHADAFLRFDPSTLTRIVLGKDMSERSRDIVRDIATRRAPALTVAVAVLNEETHRLEIV